MHRRPIPTSWSWQTERGARARTYRLLLSEAMTLVRRGRIPSVGEVALNAGVSRATAYRYFRSRSKLVTAVLEEALGPVRSYVPQSDDGLARLRELFEKTYPRFTEYEPHMRAALQLALEHESLERTGLLEEEAFRRGHRRALLHRAAAPLKTRLGAKGYERLLKALSLIYGIEPYVVLKDIWGASGREVETLSRWILDAMVETALRQAAAPAGRAVRYAAASKRERRLRRSISRPARAAKSAKIG
jgi:AcrR family transcriptional regulator